jgi:hypothetical protein
MAGSAYTGQAGPYYDYIGMICIHSYDKTGMDSLIGSSFAFKNSIEYSGSMMPVLVFSNRY